MTKIMVVPKNKKMIEKLMNKCDAFLVGIDGLSVNLPTYFNIDEVVELSNILESNNKELFISLSKNMKNKDLEKLEKTLVKLNQLNVKAILFYDLSLVNLKEKLNIKHDLVWAQNHFTTNYDTSNYWYDLGVNYGLLSAEITLDEIIEINENSNMKFIVPIFGYLPMFTSIRHLVNNYLDYFDVEKQGEQYYMAKEGNIYPIIDNKNGTSVYSGNILNGLEESMILKENNIDYFLLDSVNIDSDSFEEVLDMYNNVNKDNISEFDNKIESIFDNIDKGFLYKETVYKVKNNE